VLKSARPSARSVLIILLHGTAALQNDLPTAKRLKARAVLNPAAHAHTDQVMTVQLAIGLTGQAATDPPVIDPTVQAVTALTGLVVIGRIHQEPIVRLAQKPNVHIAQAATDPTKEEPKVQLAQKLNVLIGQAVTAQQVIAHTGRVVIVLLETALTPVELIARLALNPDLPIGQVATVPVVIAHILQELIVLLAQKPDALTGRVVTAQAATGLTAQVVTAHIHQEPIVRLAQKPSVLIGQVGTDLLATGLT